MSVLHCERLNMSDHILTFISNLPCVKIGLIKLKLMKLELAAIHY